MSSGWPTWWMGIRKGFRKAFPSTSSWKAFPINPEVGNMEYELADHTPREITPNLVVFNFLCKEQCLELSGKVCVQFPGIRPCDVPLAAHITPMFIKYCWLRIFALRLFLYIYCLVWYRGRSARLPCECCFKFPEYGLLAYHGGHWYAHFRRFPADAPLL